jgi:hypothetical protein
LFAWQGIPSIIKAAKELFDNKQSELKRIENVSWEIFPELVISPGDAEAAAKLLAAEVLDGLVISQRNLPSGPSGADSQQGGRQADPAVGV